MDFPFSPLADRPRRGSGARIGFVAVAIFLAAALSGCSGPAPVAITAPTTETTTSPAAEPAAGEPDAAMDASTDAESGREPEDAPPPALFDPASVVLELRPVVQGLQRPLYVTNAGDGSARLFVVEKEGRIRIVDGGRLLETPFLDITDRVNSSANERGLLGLAFSPAYATDGAFFVNYTDVDGSTVVARYSVSPENADLALPASERVVLTVAQPASNHNGGMLAFGPDGYLYIGTGDGGAANDRFENGQNPETLLGKMLRLDVTSDPTAPYTIPADNPWIDTDWNGTDVRDEIWAVGLRNPWRYSFDRATGDLWIGDVGQNQYEEINVVAADSPGPLNFGWPIMEANHCFADADCVPTGLELPVAEYAHTGHCSVTGGYVYRGSAYPGLQGGYLYGDYCSGVIWALAQNEQGVWEITEMADTSVQLSSFGEDEAGELYLTDLSSGTLYQVIDANAP